MDIQITNAFLYLLYQKGVISKQEYEYIRSGEYDKNVYKSYILSVATGIFEK